MCCVEGHSAFLFVFVAAKPRCSLICVFGRGEDGHHSRTIHEQMYVVTLAESAYLKLIYSFLHLVFYGFHCNINK